MATARSSLVVVREIKTRFRSAPQYFGSREAFQRPRTQDLCSKRLPTSDVSGCVLTSFAPTRGFSYSADFGGIYYDVSSP